MSKKRLAPLMLAVAAAVAALAGERGAWATEVAKTVSFLSFILFVFLFATRHRSSYGVADLDTREESESKEEWRRRRRGSR